MLYRLVANGFFSRLELTWPITSLKISKMSKNTIVGKKLQESMGNYLDKILDGLTFHLWCRLLARHGHLGFFLLFIFSFFVRFMLILGAWTISNLQSTGLATG